MDKNDVLNEIKNRFPRISTYFVILIILVLFTHFAVPYLTFFKDFKIFDNVNLYVILNVFFPLIILFTIFKIYSQISPILDFLVYRIVSTLPGVKKIEEKPIKRILSDLTYIIIVILILTGISPSLSKFFEIAVNFNFASLMIIILLLYDIGKTIQFITEERLKRIKHHLRKSRLKHKVSKE